MHSTLRSDCQLPAVDSGDWRLRPVRETPAPPLPRFSCRDHPTHPTPPHPTPPHPTPAPSDPTPPHPTPPHPRDPRADGWALPAQAPLPRPSVGVARSEFYRGGSRRPAPRAVGWARGEAGPRVGPGATVGWIACLTQGQSQLLNIRCAALSSALRWYSPGATVGWSGCGCGASNVPLGRAGHAGHGPGPRG
jgi:hypothetical protein